MKFTIRETTFPEKIIEMDNKMFPGAGLDANRVSGWWICHNENREPVGYSTISLLGEGIAFLSRAGVIPGARGHRLHRRFIRVRERWARKRGMRYLITYVSKENPSSYCGLIKRGYEVYNPEWDYVGDKYLYLRKRL